MFAIHNHPNGTNINDKCGALHPESLIKHVKQYRADIGIALDGDADRLIVIDEKGERLDGDEILAICGIYYLKNKRLHNNTLVATIMSNLGLDHCLRQHKGRVIRTDVGDRNVVTAMCKHKLNLGGEQSGHLIFRDSSTTGDGILAALCLLEVIIKSQKPLNDLKQVLKKKPQIQKDLNIPARVPLEQLPDLEKKIAEFNKELQPEGRLLFRYSGTELKARFLAETENPQQVLDRLNDLTDFTEKNILAYCKQHQLI